MRYTTKKLLIFTMLSLLVWLMLPTSSLYAKNLKKSPINKKATVKIGYFDYPGYFEINEYGEITGFGYEVANKIASYTGWNVEFVARDKGWSEQQQMLRDRDIDLLLNMNRSPEREKFYSYSNFDIGSFDIVLTAADSDRRFVFGKEALYGAKVGVLRGDASIGALTEYSIENGYSFNYSYYKDLSDLKNALNNHDIDLMMNISFGANDAGNIVDVIYTDYSYIASDKDNLKLLNEADNAIALIKELEPFYFYDLSNKYFGTDNIEKISFSREERDFINKNKEKTFNAIIVGNYRPLSYYENGKAFGIIPDYLELLKRLTGLNIEIETLDNVDFEDYARENTEYIRLDTLYSYPLAEQYGYRITMPYIELPMTMVHTRRNRSNGTIGYLQSSDADVTIYRTRLGEDFMPIYSLDSLEDCLLSGVIDSAYIPIYIAQYMKANRPALRFEIEQLSNTYGLSIGVYSPDSAVLCRILSKAISAVRETDMQKIIVKHVGDFEDYNLSLKDFINLYPWLTWAFGVFLIIVLAIIAILIIKNYSTKKFSTLALQNMTYLKAILDVNMFAIKIDLLADGDRTYTFYSSDKSSKSIDGVKKYNVNKERLEYYRNKVVQDDLETFDRFLSDENLINLFESGSQDYTELRAKNHAGDYIYVSMAVNVMGEIGGVKSFLLVVSDINDYKSKEEEKKNALLMALDTARSYSESKTVFLSQMSHDIRTPLNAIVGMSTIAKTQLDEPEKVSECLDVVLSSSEHLLSLVSEILDMTKIESGKLSLREEEFSIENAFETTVSMHKNKAKLKNIELNINDMLDSHKVVIGDETRIRQIFINILSNSVKYTSENGHITVSISGHSSQKDDTFIYEFSVTDDGIGMSEETLRVLFEPFERAKEVRFTEGTGLGMAITKNIVDALGGLINVSSELNKGTTVTISIPLKIAFDADFKPATAEKTENKVIKKTQEGKRALIVEDVEINAIFSEAIANMKGFETTIAVNGEEAVKMLEESADGYYSIVLMDIQMPVMNGYEATKLIRASKREYLRNIPIVAMSANAFADDILNCKAVGMNDHISKPVDIGRFSDICDLYVKD